MDKDKDVRLEDLRTALREYFGIQPHGVVVAISDGANVSCFFSGGHVQCLGLVPFIEREIFKNLDAAIKAASL